MPSRLFPQQSSTRCLGNAHCSAEGAPGSQPSLSWVICWKQHTGKIWGANEACAIWICLGRHRRSFVTKWASMIAGLFCFQGWFLWGSWCRGKGLNFPSTQLVDSSSELFPHGFYLTLESKESSNLVSHLAWPSTGKADQTWGNSSHCKKRCSET